MDTATGALRPTTAIGRISSMSVALSGPFDFVASAAGMAEDAQCTVRNVRALSKEIRPFLPGKSKELDAQATALEAKASGSLSLSDAPGIIHDTCAISGAALDATRGIKKYAVYALVGLGVVGLGVLVFGGMWCSKRRKA